MMLLWQIASEDDILLPIRSSHEDTVAGKLLSTENIAGSHIGRYVELIGEHSLMSLPILHSRTQCCPPD